MRSKLNKLFIGLSFGALVISGCSLMPQRSKKSVDDSSLSPTQPANNGVGENVEPYAGNPNRTIGKIQNTPVRAYQPATMEKIASFVELIHGTASEEMVDAFAECMLAFNLGDNLACAVCDFIIEYSGMGGAIYENDNYADILVDYYYDALKILNSTDFSYAANFFTELNRIYREMCTKDSYYDVDSIGIADYYSPSYGYEYLSYREYLEIKNHKNDFNNPSLNELISAYDSAYGSLRFTQSQQARYEEAMEARRQEAENMTAVPEYLVSFVRRHAADSKEMLLNKLKIAVDAASEFAPLVADLINKTSSNQTGYSSNYLRVYTSNGYSLSLYDGENSSRQQSDFTIRDYAAKFLEKRQIVLGLAKTILADEQFGNLVVDAATELMIPLLKEIYSDEGNNSAIFARLNTKLNSLSGKHVAALASFLLNLVNQIYDEDIIDFISYYYGGSEKEFDIFAFGDKYIDKLTAAVSALSANDKALITELVEVAGFDLFAEISTFTQIYKGKNLNTDQGKEAFSEAMSEFWQEVSDKISNSIGLTYYEDDYPDSGSNRYQNVEISFDGVVQGDTQEAIINKLYINYYDVIHYGDNNDNTSSVNFSGYYYSWNEYTQSAAEEYASFSYEERNSYYAARTYLRSQLIVSNLQLSSVDTSACGYADVQCSFTMNGNNYTAISTILIRPNGSVPTINKIDNRSSTSKYSYSSGSNLGPVIYELNDRVSFYDETTRDHHINLTADKLGWNMYVNKAEDDYSNYDYSAFVYYVVDPNSMANNIIHKDNSYGYYYLGENDFSQSPSIYTEYDCDGLILYSQQRLSFDKIANNVSSLSADRKYTVNDDGEQFSFIVLDPDNYYERHYEFSVEEEISGEIKQARNMRMSVYVSSYYRSTIDGVEYRTNRYVPDYDKVATNFTYTNNVISFKYDGQTFTFDASSLSQYLTY